MGILPQNATHPQQQQFTTCLIAIKMRNTYFRDSKDMDDDWWFLIFNTICSIFLFAIEGYGTRMGYCCSCWLLCVLFLHTTSEKWRTAYQKFRDINCLLADDKLCLRVCYFLKYGSFSPRQVMCYEMVILEIFSHIQLPFRFVFFGTDINICMLTHNFIMLFVRKRWKVNQIYISNKDVLLFLIGCE